MSQGDARMNINGRTIENVDHYIYRGHLFKFGKENQITEIKIRIRLYWAAFGRLNYIFKNPAILI